MTAGAAKRVGVVTVSRSDYGHLRPVLEALRRAPDLELLLLVAGMHLASEFGLTVRDIEADGFPISARVEMLGGATHRKRWRPPRGKEWRDSAEPLRRCAR